MSIRKTTYILPVQISIKKAIAGSFLIILVQLCVSLNLNIVFYEKKVWYKVSLSLCNTQIMYVFVSIDYFLWPINAIERFILWIQLELFCRVGDRFATDISSWILYAMARKVCKIELENQIYHLFSTCPVNCKYTSGYNAGIFQKFSKMLVTQQSGCASGTNCSRNLNSSMKNQNSEHLICIQIVKYW